MRVRGTLNVPDPAPGSTVRTTSADLKVGVAEGVTTVVDEVAGVGVDKRDVGAVVWF
jgi:hypothetical protein